MHRSTEEFGHFDLIDKIADGGMGEIFLAADLRLRRPVAIKRALKKFRNRPDVSRMFETEATVMSMLRHDHIVRIFESGEADDVFYIAMEYVHGKTLRQVVDRCREIGEPLPPGLAVEIMEKLGRALRYAHHLVGPGGSTLGLVHRDINPANFLIGYDGSVKLIDFGIVQTDDELAPVELEPKGKSAYMSPEQLLGHRLDRRSDLFSLGICLYEALTLYNPFIHEDKSLSVGEAIQTLEVPPLAQRNHRLAVFDPLVSRLLAKELEYRIDDTDAFVRELLRAADEAKIASFSSLEAFMGDAFERHKAQDDELLAETEIACQSRVRRPRKLESTVSQAADFSASTSGAPLVDAPAPTTQRGPFALFLLLLVVIVAATIQLSTVAYRLATGEALEGGSPATGASDDSDAIEP